MLVVLDLIKGRLANVLEISKALALLRILGHKEIQEDHNN